MKNLLLKTLLIAGIATTIIACSKEDEPKAEEPTLKAKWEITSDIRINKLNNDTTLNDTVYYEENELVYEFINDSTIVASSDSIPFKTLKYKYENNVLTTIEIKSVGGNDTTVFGTVEYSLTDLKLVSEETQVFPGNNTVKSFFIINAKRK